MYGIDQCDEIIRLIDEVLRDNRPANEPVAHMDVLMWQLTTSLCGNNYIALK